MLETLLACEGLNLSGLNLDDEGIAVLGLAGLFLLALTGMATGAIKSIASGRAREASRREIAAYIAEGSMTADEGERLLNAGKPHWQRWHT